MASDYLAISLGGRFGLLIIRAADRYEKQKEAHKGIA